MLKQSIITKLETLEERFEEVQALLADPEIANDPSVATLLDNLSSTCTLEDLMVPANNKLAVEVMNTLGWNDLNQSTYEAKIRSAHSSSCHIYITRQGGLKNPLIMWISTTDSTGKKDTSNTSTDPDSIGNCIVIR